MVLGGFWMPTILLPIIRGTLVSKCFSLQSPNYKEVALVPTERESL